MYVRSVPAHVGSRCWEGFYARVGEGYRPGRCSLVYGFPPFSPLSSSVLQRSGKKAEGLTEGLEKNNRGFLYEDTKG